MSGIRSCIDTNILLNVINREDPDYSYSKNILLNIENSSLHAVIPVLVISEILTGFYIEKNNKNAEQFISTITKNENISIIPFSLDIAIYSAKVRSQTGLKLPDSIILATAVKTHANFLISNDNGFPEAYDGIKIVSSVEMNKILND